MDSKLNLVHGSKFAGPNVEDMNWYVIKIFFKYSTSEIYIPEKIESSISKEMFTHPGSLQHNSQGQEVNTAWVSIGGWTDEVRYILTIEFYYSASRRRKFWHRLQGGWTLRTSCYEISQSQKYKYYMIPLIWGTHSTQTRRRQSRKVVGRNEGEKKIEKYCVIGIKFQDGKSIEHGYWWWVPNSVNVIDPT